MKDLVALNDLLRHMEWADSRMWEAVLSHAEAANMDEMRERLQHIHFVQRAFLKVWRGEPLNPKAASFDDHQSLLQWARTLYPEATSYVGALSAEDLERPVRMPWIEMFEQRMGQKAEDPSLGETVFQVAMHSAHHRGQVSTRLRQLGGEPPLLDFIVWVWLGKPEPAWPSD